MRLCTEGGYWWTMRYKPTKRAVFQYQFHMNSSCLTVIEPGRLHRLAILYLNGNQTHVSPTMLNPQIRQTAVVIALACVTKLLGGYVVLSQGRESLTRLTRPFLWGPNHSCTTISTCNNKNWCLENFVRAFIYICPWQKSKVDSPHTGRAFWFNG